MDLLPIPYSPITHLYHSYIISSPFPLHGSVPYALAVHWGSGSSCLRATHVLPAHLITIFSGE